MDQGKKPDFKIAYDGTWYHDGAPIRRAALARLFAGRALKVDEAGRYWLQTPFEKYPVTVEDVPFVIVDYEVKGGDIDFRTNMDETVELGPGHGLELRDGIPYIPVRDGLYARLGRSVYYNLVETFGGIIRSRGTEHVLGETDA
jgi:hypothetical protein